MAAPSECPVSSHSPPPSVHHSHVRITYPRSLVIERERARVARRDFLFKVLFKVQGSLSPLLKWAENTRFAESVSSHRLGFPSRTHGEYSMEGLGSR